MSKERRKMMEELFTRHIVLGEMAKKRSSLAQTKGNENKNAGKRA